MGNVKVGRVQADRGGVVAPASPADGPGGNWVGPPAPGVATAALGRSRLGRVVGAPSFATRARTLTQVFRETASVGGLPLMSVRPAAANSFESAFQFGRPARTSTPLRSAWCSTMYTKSDDRRSTRAAISSRDSGILLTFCITSALLLHRLCITSRHSLHHFCIACASGWFSHTKKHA